MRRVTIADIAIALAAGSLLAESPFTPDDVGPSLAAATALAAFVLWYRSTHPTGVAGASESTGLGAAKILATLRRMPPGAVAAVVLYAAIFAPTLQWMYARWTGGLWQNQHGMIMAVLIVLLSRSALRRSHGPLDTSAWGFPPLCLGLALLVLDAGIQTHYLAAIGFSLGLPGLSLLILGRTRSHALRLPLAMAIFLVPIPSTIATHLLLRQITAVGTSELLSLFGIAISREVSLLFVPGGTFIVSDACSGFATLTAVIALSMMLIFHCRSRARQIAIVLVLVPLVLVANTVRVFILVLLSLAFGPGVLDTMAHEASGVAVFFLLLATLFLMADRPSLRNALA